VLSDKKWRRPVKTLGSSHKPPMSFFLCADDSRARSRAATKSADCPLVFHALAASELGDFAAKSAGHAAENLSAWMADKRLLAKLFGNNGNEAEAVTHIKLGRWSENKTNLIKI
jgi:hypothetical protein